MAEVDVKGIGAVLTRYREVAGLTVDQVAERMGVRRSQVTKYETDVVDPPDHRLEAFALAVGACPVELSLECLFYAKPHLRNTTTGRLFLQGLEEHQRAVAEADPPKASAKKPAGKKPATRSPPRRRVSR